MELLVVITIIGILIALLLPAVQAAREAARRMQCANNFKQVGLALHTYHAAVGCFPPGMLYIDGQCWGWAAYILPYLEQQALYDRIDFAAPGYYANSRNQRVSATVVSAYLCPSDPQSGELVTVHSDPEPNVAMTSMDGVSDSEAWIEWKSGGYWPKDFPKNNGILGGNRSCSFADIKDGTSNTLMVGEVTGGGKGTYLGDFWASWNLADTRDGVNGPYSAPGGTYANAAGFSSFHPGGCNFLVADGSVSFISQNISSGERPPDQPPSVLHSLTTRAGGENATIP